MRSRPKHWKRRDEGPLVGNVHDILSEIPIRRFKIELKDWRDQEWQLSKHEAMRKDYVQRGRTSVDVMSREILRSESSTNYRVDIGFCESGPSTLS